jgi:hypothetical protein
VALPTCAKRRGDDDWVPKPFVSGVAVSSVRFSSASVRIRVANACRALVDLRFRFMFGRDSHLSCALEESLVRLKHPSVLAAILAAARPTSDHCVSGNRFNLPVRNPVMEVFSFSLRC